MAKKKRRSTAKKKSPVRRRSRAKKIAVRKRAGVKRTVKRKTARKRKPAKAKGRRLIKQVERRSVERVMAGKRRRKGSARKRKVVMAGRSRKRTVGGISGTGLLIAGGLGLAAIYLLTKKNSPAAPGGTYTLPPLATSNNYTRNTQASDLVQYAVAGGLAIDAIIKLIDRLNTSSDQEVDNIYDRVTTTGDFGTYV